ncbi:MAG: hypothetical protein JWO73_808 [Candidatus Taylorbacteria bacterium]|nr:hypothetical protein [Candidatus Taylorbacteria bacterium]
MKPIREIYSEYRLMPNLQTHQLRVAAVAKQICESIDGFTETHEVVLACLLHDMGNIIKFDLTHFPEFVQPEGIEYWQKIKDEFILKYGSDEHAATERIAREVGASEKTLVFVDNVGFRKLLETESGNSLGQKICAYADMRVGPKGVLSIAERTADLRKRYEGRVRNAMSPEALERHYAALGNIERQIFLVSNMRPEDISDDSVLMTLIPDSHCVDAVGLTHPIVADSDRGETSSVRV